MLFTAASRGFPAMDGFLVFPRVRVRIRVRVREALSYGPLAMAALSHDEHESLHRHGWAVNSINRGRVKLLSAAGSKKIFFAISKMQNDE